MNRLSVNDFTNTVNIVRINPKILKNETFYKKFSTEEIKILFEIGVKIKPNTIKYVPENLCYFVHERVEKITKWYHDLYFDAIKQDSTIIMKQFDNKAENFLDESTQDIRIYCVKLLGKKYIESSSACRLSMFSTSDERDDIHKKFKLRSEIIEFAISYGNLNLVKYIYPYIIWSIHGDLCEYPVAVNTPKEIEAYNICKRIYYKVISQNGLMLRYIKFIHCRTPELCEIAVKNCPTSIQFVSPKNNEFTDEIYKNLCEKAVILGSQNRFISRDENFIITFEKKNKDGTIIFTREYLHSLFRICHNIALSQLNLLEIAAVNSNKFTNIIFDVYELISEYI